MRKILQLVLLAIFVSAGSLCGVTGSSVRSGPVVTRLASSCDALTRGVAGEIWIGWVMSLQPGWHVYWQHPGDVGSPPLIDWVLPDGCSVSELLYPPPQKVSMSGYRANGYKGEVVFLARLTIPPAVSGSDLKILARVSWLACSKICLPGSAELSLEIPLLDAARKDLKWNETFERMIEGQPREIPENWSLRLSSAGAFYKLIFPPELSGESCRLEVFTENRLVRSSVPPQRRRQNDRMEWLLKKSEWATGSTNRMRGLLRVGSQDANDTFYRFDLPILSE